MQTHRKSKALSDTAIKNAKPRARDYALYDSLGLYILIRPNKSKLWRLKYKNKNGDPALAGLGKYPEVSLAAARAERDAIRKRIAGGVEPQDKKRADRRALAGTFKAIALEWLDLYDKKNALSTAKKTRRLLERDVFPKIGNRPIGNIEAIEVLECVRRIERRSVDTAHRALTHFQYAVATDLAKFDVTRDIRTALGDLSTKHFPAITEPKAVGELLRAIDGFTGTFPVACALRLAPMWFVRPGELRAAEWAEFDLDEALWTIPPRRRKLSKRKKEETDTQPHVVPLSMQALAILRELNMFTGESKYLFPSIRSHMHPMSDMTINAALRRLGYDQATMTTHGFRAMARTVLDQVLKQRVDIIEHQLAHRVRDPLGQAYNRTTFLPERRQMMQEWSDYLDTLRDGKPAPAAQVKPDVGASARRHLRVIV